ncbi:hypothetical protein Ptr902_04891 [Pyrenophora tritici-repentis]|nr:hypothetical protein Ptr902_04891 [Pyrenophora tritici-repentis]
MFFTSIHGYLLHSPLCSSDSAVMAELRQRESDRKGMTLPLAAAWEAPMMWKFCNDQCKFSSESGDKKGMASSGLLD